MIRNKWILFVGLGVIVLSIVACSNVVNKQDSSDVNSAEDESMEQTKIDSEAKGHTEKPGDENDSDQGADDELDDQESSRIIVNENDSISALVNKQNSLDENYVPDDLVTIEVPFVLENPEVNQLRRVAADALKDMFEAAKNSDVHLYARSGYRSYQTQVQLFESYSEKHGEEKANQYSARPGQSEHQTGLVMDITSESVNFLLEEKFGEMKEGTWVEKNAHEFGFIIRYPEGKEEITKYTYEPWHLRFLGVELATKIYESDLAYEEFLVKEGIIDEVHAEALN